MHKKKNKQHNISSEFYQHKMLGNCVADLCHVVDNTKLVQIWLHLVYQWTNWAHLLYQMQQLTYQTNHYTAL